MFEKRTWRNGTLPFLFIHILLPSTNHSFIHSVTHTLTYLHTHSLTHSPTQSYTHSLTHSCTHTHTHTHTLITSGAVAGWWVSTDLELTSLECEFNNGGGGGEQNMNSRISMIVSALLRNNVTGSSMVWKSLKRALTTSFGSICLGSLLVSTLRVLRMMVELTTKSMRSLHNYSGESFFLFSFSSFLIFFFF